MSWLRTYAPPSSSSPFLENGNLVLALDLSYAKCSGLQLLLPYDEGYFSTTGEGANLRAANGEWGFESSSDGGKVFWEMNLKGLGINGTVEFSRVAPPHVQCSAIEEGASIEMWWNLMWINTMPHAVAKVDLSINGNAWAFEGVGYHDQNWGVYPYYFDLNQWYWGHGRTEDHSVVWFYRISPTGLVKASAYVSQDDHIVYAGCGDGVTVRTTTEEGIVYPLPFGFDGTITGLKITVDASDAGKFAFTATSRRNVFHSNAYERWIGELSGGQVGAKNSTGVALWELMGPFQKPELPFDGN